MTDQSSEPFPALDRLAIHLHAPLINKVWNATERVYAWGRGAPGRSPSSHLARFAILAVQTVPSRAAALLDGLHRIVRIERKAATTRIEFTDYFAVTLPDVSRNFQFIALWRNTTHQQESELL